MEQWKQMQDIYDGRYWISNLGNVKTTYNSILHYMTSFEEAKDMAKIFIKQKNVTTLKINLCIGGKIEGGSRKGKTKTFVFCVHKLVAKYFIDNPKGYSRVKFKDRDRSNVNFSNLEWYPSGKDLVFKSEEEKAYYIKSSDGIPLDFFDSAVINYMKGDSKELFSILYRRDVLNYIGKAMLNTNPYTNVFSLRDNIKDGYLFFLNLINLGAYRVCDISLKKYSPLAYLTKTVVIFICSNRKEVFKQDYENTSPKEYTKTKSETKEDFELYLDDIQRDIEEMFSEFA